MEDFEGYLVFPDEAAKLLIKLRNKKTNCELYIEVDVTWLIEYVGYAPTVP